MTVPHALTADDLDVGAPPADPWPWMDDALCRHADPDLWFPSRDQQSTTEAVEVCQLCPVTDACLDYAQTEGITYGVFGGQTPAERKRTA